MKPLLFLVLFSVFQACNSADNTPPWPYQEEQREEQQEDKSDREKLDEQQLIDEKNREVNVD